MKIHRGVLAVVVAGAVVTAACGSDGESADTAAAATEAQSDSGAEQSAQIDPVQFRRDVRVLWEDHVAWTRLFIVSAVAGLPDTDATAARLLQNQADIGDAVAGFYGDDAGAQVEDRSAAWYANADEIAEFLAAANPAWPVNTLKDMMRGHLDQTLAEATAQLTGGFEASVTEYAHITTHILQMADTLADGIITQFPDRFLA